MKKDGKKSVGIKAIKEGYDITPLAEEEKVGIVESLKLTFTNKPFMRWCLVNCCSFFGLQMFLVSMNALILGGMGMNGMQMAILNTCAFAPVLLMLYMFNKLKQINELLIEKNKNKRLIFCELSTLFLYLQQKKHG